MTNRGDLENSVEEANLAYRTLDYDADSRLVLFHEFKSDGSRIVYQSIGYDIDNRLVSLFLHPKPAAFTLKRAQAGEKGGARVARKGRDRGGIMVRAGERKR